MNQIGKNLKRIRLLKNLSLEKAGILMNMSAPAISKYEKGLIVPNSQKLIEFANAYNVKVIDLLKTYSTPQMSFHSFRKKQRLQGQNLNLLKEIIQNKVSDYLEVLEMNNIQDNHFKLKRYECINSDDAEEAAYLFRKDYQLSINQPISDLINVLENIGIVILQIDNTDEKFSDFDGLSEIVNGIPIIALLKDVDGARQRFTIAHELGHLVLNIINNEHDEEIQDFLKNLKNERNSYYIVLENLIKITCNKIKKICEEAQIEDDKNVKKYLDELMNSISKIFI